VYNHLVFYEKENTKMVKPEPIDAEPTLSAVIVAFSNYMWSLHERIQRLEQTPQSVQAQVNSMVAPPAKRVFGRCRPTKWPQKRVRAWIRETLASGPMPSAKYNHLAEQAGISQWELKQANKSLVTKFRKYVPDLPANFCWFARLKNGEN
jgi:hypothetical protein